MAIHRNQVSAMNTDQFLQDVEEGLSRSPKTLPSKYFYDQRGDELFVEIMNMPEYYLTRAEHEILRTQSPQIINALRQNRERSFELIELGAGDGTKTRELLRVLLAEKYKFGYVPVDISQNAVDQLEASLLAELPELDIYPRQGDYFNILSELKDTTHPKVVLFLGSNIGNMSDEIAGKFIYDLGANLHAGDYLLLGVDLIKSKDVVLPAYNDSQGITREFNMNLLRRINRELEGDFDLDAFEHAPEYEESEGVARSFLKSLTNQTVHLNGCQFDFEEGECIRTEISRKYDDDVLNRILENTDFEIERRFTDEKGLFADYLLRRH